RCRKHAKRTRCSFDCYKGFTSAVSNGHGGGYAEYADLQRSSSYVSRREQVQEACCGEFHRPSHHRRDGFGSHSAADTTANPDLAIGCIDCAAAPAIADSASRTKSTGQFF